MQLRTKGKEEKNVLLDEKQKEKKSQMIAKKKFVLYNFHKGENYGKFV